MTFYKNNCDSVFKHIMNHGAWKCDLAWSIRSVKEKCDAKPWGREALYFKLYHKLE